MSRHEPEMALALTLAGWLDIDCLLPDATPEILS